jgi:ATP-dependent DNA ligase
VKAFAELLDRLAFTPSRLGKLGLMVDYFRSTQDPDRGFALAALTGTLALTQAKPALIRDLVADRVDPELFGWSYDFVGDLAETAALIWPAKAGANRMPSLHEVVEGLRETPKSGLPELLARWLDALDPTARWALLKLITGGLRVGVSARLAKTALAELGGVPVGDIEELWHGLEPPYMELFAWLTGAGARPEPDARLRFRPLMLAHPLEAQDLSALDPDQFRAEWKWDGIRVQLAAHGARDGARIFSRSADDISRAFPEILATLTFDAVLDGELLILEEDIVRPFAELQQRLNRKTVTPALLSRFPAHVRLYDILFEGEEDLRGSGFDARRARLSAWFERVRPARMDLSPLIAFASWDELAQRQRDARADGIEGLMLKRRDSPYLAGRPKGPWFKWKRDALVADCVLMYAQRGHGKRSSFYSDYTFGAWRGDELVPVGKAYFGFTDAELEELDRWIRTHTTERFGPVRQVEPRLVFEVAFDGVQRSNRHKSGLAMRFPRISRIRWDKPANEADTVETLAALAPAGAGV